MAGSWWSTISRAIRGRKRRLKVWHHPAFRLPLTQVPSRRRLEPRRADLVLWYLRQISLLPSAGVRVARRASIEELALVHTTGWLAELSDGPALARVLGLESLDDPDVVFDSFRYGVGATVGAAREQLARGGPALNLHGGFHHAHPDRGSGFCPVNDLAVAIAVLRREGFRGRVLILDLDAHPGDGTAECIARDGGVTMGCISGVDWGPMPGVDQVVLPAGSGDAAYLDALEALLGRKVKPDLALVVAGGDVVRGDPLGTLGLSYRGIRARDRRVMEYLGAIPSVWVPGGGYTPDAWRILAGTALELVGLDDEVPADADPMGGHFEAVSESLPVEEGGGAWITEADLGVMGGPSHRYLDHYTAAAVELALQEYGILGAIGRLGYDDFRVALDRTGVGERFRLTGEAGGQRHLLVESVVGLQDLEGHRVLYVHWLTLRHPKGRFTPDRPQLPGQDTPGLGLAWEAGELLFRMAHRLGLAGVAFRPATVHSAWAARTRFRFASPVFQGRFEALLRDLGKLPLGEVARAIDAGRVRCDGLPYSWDAEPMVLWLDGSGAEDGAVAEERRRVRFSVVAGQ